MIVRLSFVQNGGDKFSLMHLFRHPRGKKDKSVSVLRFCARFCYCHLKTFCTLVNCNKSYKTEKINHFNCLIYDYNTKSNQAILSLLTPGTYILLTFMLFILSSVTRQTLFPTGFFKFK